MTTTPEFHKEKHTVVTHNTLSQLTLIQVSS